MLCSAKCNFRVTDKGLSLVPYLMTCPVFLIPENNIGTNKSIAGGERGSKHSQWYLTKSERNMVTGVKICLLRCHSRRDFPNLLIRMSESNLQKWPVLKAAGLFKDENYHIPEEYSVLTEITTATSNTFSHKKYFICWITELKIKWFSWKFKEPNFVCPDSTKKGKKNKQTLMRSFA